MGIFRLIRPCIFFAIHRTLPTMRFEEIPGLFEVKQRLINNAKSGRIPHAQLFLGPEGSANLALAWAYAQYLACEHKTEADSCGMCSACHKMKKAIHPDLHFSYPTVGEKGLSTEFISEWREQIETNPYLNVYDWLLALDKENKQGNISAAECRDIIKKLSLKAFESPFKFLILWMPEYLGKYGNILLKVIEEPPANTLFLLVANEQEEIISTILSRTQIVKIPRFSDEEVAEHLIQHGASSEDHAASLAFLSEGNMNKAIHLLSQQDTPFFAHFRQLLLSSYSRRIPDMMKWADESAKLGRENLKHLLEYGINVLREVVLVQQGAPELVKVRGQEQDFAQKFAQLAAMPALSEIINELSKSTYYIERNANARLVLFNLSLRIKNILSSSKAK